MKTLPYYLILLLSFLFFNSCKKEIKEHVLSNQTIIRDGMTNNVQNYFVNKLQLKSGGTKGRARVDFNGDNQSDFASIWNDNGSWSIDVYLSGLNKYRWTTNDGSWFSGQTICYGDFNGDGKTDIARFWSDGGYWSVDVHRSTGYNFVRTRWATKQGRVYPVISWFIADFNRDGKDDIANFWKESNGKISADVHLSTGSSFSAYRWASFAGSWIDNMKLFIGDFNADNLPDVLIQFNDNNSWSFDLYRNTGYSFVKERWSTRVAGVPTSEIRIIGDFNGDGRDDIARAFYEGDGVIGDIYSIDVHSSTGYSLVKNRWLSYVTLPYGGKSFTSADLNKDGADDIFEYTPSTYRDIDCGRYYYRLTSNLNSFTGENIYLGKNTVYPFLSYGDYNGDNILEFLGVGNTVEYSNMEVEIHSIQGNIISTISGGEFLRDMQFVY